MRRNILYVAIAVAALGCGTDSEAKESKSKAGHQFRGSVEVRYRTNENISVAPSSNSRFNFASLSEFGIDDEEEGEGDDEDDDEDEDDGFDDFFDDLADVDPDEDDIEEDDAVDEDGDGIDDLLDPDVDVLVDKESRFTAKLALTHKYTFEGGGVAWANSARFSSDTHEQRDELDKFNSAFTTGFEFARKGNPHKFRPSLSWVSLEVDDKRFVSTFVASLAYTYEVSKQLTLGATYNYQDKDLVKPQSPDSNIDTLSLTASFKATDFDIVNLKWAPKVEDSSQVTRNTDASGFEIAYTRKLPWDMTAGLGYRYDTVEYSNLVPRREDDNRTWSVQATKEFDKAFSVEVGFETRERESNIPGKDAENDSVYLSAVYKF